MCAAFHHAAVVEHDDVIGFPHGRQPVCDDQRGAFLHQALERAAHQRLVDRVEMRRRLVQNENGCVFQERPRDRDALTLAAGKVDAALAHHGLQAVGQGRDKIAERRARNRILDIRRGRIGARDRDIGVERVVEEIGVLGHQGDTRTQRIELRGAEVFARHIERAAVRVPKAHEQMRDRRLAGARGADQRQRFAGGHGEAHIAQRLTVLARIGEIDVAQLHGRRCGGPRGAALARGTGAVLDQDRRCMHGMEPAGGAEGIGELAADMRDFGDRQKRRHAEHGKQRQECCIKCALRDQTGTHHDDGEPAEPRYGLDQGRLKGQVAVIRQAHPMVLVDRGEESCALVALPLEGQNFREALQGIDRLGIQSTQHFACARAMGIEALSHQKRAETDEKDERRQRKRHGPAEEDQRDQHGARHEQRYQRGRHRVGEEIFDALDILCRHADQIARAPAQQISRAQPVQFFEQRDAHLGQQAKRHIVRDPGFEPMQDAGEGRQNIKPDQRAPHLDTVFDARHHKRAEHADADERDDARDTQCKRKADPAAKRPDETQQRRTGAGPAEIARPQNLIRRIEGGDRPVFPGCIALGGRNTVGVRCRPGFTSLLRHKGGVDTLVLDQRLVPPAFGHAAFVEHQNTVGIDHA